MKSFKQYIQHIAEQEEGQEEVKFSKKERRSIVKHLKGKGGNELHIQDTHISTREPSKSHHQDYRHNLHQHPEGSLERRVADAAHGVAKTHLDNWLRQGKKGHSISRKGKTRRGGRHPVQDQSWRLAPLPEKKTPPKKPLKESSGGTGLVKGWVNYKTGKVISNTSMKPYHVQMIAKSPRTFNITEKSIKNYLMKKLEQPDWKWILKGKTPEQQAEIVDDKYDDLVVGNADIDGYVEMMAMKKGWHRFVNSNGWISIKGSMTEKELHAASKHLDNKLNFFDGRVKNLDMAIRTINKGSFTIDDRAKKRWDLTGARALAWVKYGGNPDRPNKAPKPSKRMNYRDVQKRGSFPPGYDEWGPTKGRNPGAKGRGMSIYNHKEYPTKSFQKFLSEING